METQAFERLVRRAMAHYHAPGMAVAVIDQDGQELYTGLFGCRDEEERLPVTRDTIFGLASLTKSFTCIAIMQLSESGAIDVNESVSRYLPALKDTEITVGHLMEHTAGFYPLSRITAGEVAKDLHISDGGHAELAFSSELALEGQRRVISRLNSIDDAKRLSKPGRYLSYCNDGYGLLSEIIRIYGDEPSFAEYLKKHILDPLGMNRSGCEFVSPFQDADHTSLYIDIEGKHTKINSFYHNAFVLNGGGAMRSTLSDMEKYLCALMNGGRGLVSKASFEYLTRPGPLYGYRSRYCRGLSASDVDGVKILSHNGGLTGISNRMLWADELGLGVLALCNKSLFPIGTVAHGALRAIGMGKTVDAPEALPPSLCSELRENEADVLGKYRSDEGAYWRLYRGRDGSLLADTAGRTQIPLAVLEDGTLALNCPFDTQYLIPTALDGGRRGLRAGGRILEKMEEQRDFIETKAAYPVACSKGPEAADEAWSPSFATA